MLIGAILAMLLISTMKIQHVRAVDAQPVMLDSQRLADLHLQPFGDEVVSEARRIDGFEQAGSVLPMHVDSRADDLFGHSIGGMHPAAFAIAPPSKLLRIIRCASGGYAIPAMSQ
jgi:hypothetical protein